MVLRNPSGQFRKRGSYSGGGFEANSTLARGIANFEFKTYEGLEENIEEFAREVEEYARSNAPWNDRTGDARAGLRTNLIDSRNSLGFELYHTVDYGIWLEIRWGGKYAIILPTVEAMGPKLYQAWGRLLEDIVYYA